MVKNYQSLVAIVTLTIRSEMVLVIEQCLVPKGRVGTLVESDQGSVFTKQPKVILEKS
jgi:hypothetical protein